MRRLAPIFLLCLSVSVLGAIPAGAQRNPVVFSKSPILIESGGKSHKFTVELALSQQQQMQGLMFRRQMAPDAGMLFVYRREEPNAMWMRNTFLPLDMLFIGRDGVVKKIVERAVPLSETTIRSGGPVVAVLELNAGTVSRLGLKPGDKVIAAVLGTGD